MKGKHEGDVLYLDRRTAFNGTLASVLNRVARDSPRADERAKIRFCRFAVTIPELHIRDRPSASVLASLASLFY